MFIDTHCHLNFDAFKADWQGALKKAQDNEVEKIIVVGTDIETSQKGVEMAKQNKALYATVGFHPHHANALIQLPYARVQLAQITDQLKKLAKNQRVIAIGECGLDYHVYEQTKYIAPLTQDEWKKLKILQKQMFGMQVQLAKEMDLPMIIHNREAEMDIIDTLDHFCKNDGQYPQGVFHCFSGSKNYLNQVLKAGFYIGVDANITYDKAVQATAIDIPLKRLLLETDSPYLTPAPNRRLRNEPVNVKIVAEWLAKIKKTTIKQIAAETTRNAQNLFKL